MDERFPNDAAVPEPGAARSRLSGGTRTGLLGLPVELPASVQSSRALRSRETTLRFRTTVDARRG